MYAAGDIYCRKIGSKNNIEHDRLLLKSGDPGIKESVELLKQQIVHDMLLLKKLCE